MRISDWSSDVCSSDLPYIETQALLSGTRKQGALIRGVDPVEEGKVSVLAEKMVEGSLDDLTPGSFNIVLGRELSIWIGAGVGDKVLVLTDVRATPMGAVKQMRSEEHTSELQSLMRSSYAVFCLKKKTVQTYE